MPIVQGSETTGSGCKLVHCNLIRGCCKDGLGSRACGNGMTGVIAPPQKNRNYKSASDFKRGAIFLQLVILRSFVNKTQQYSELLCFGRLIKATKLNEEN